MMKSSLIRINLIFTLLVLFIPNLVSAELKTFTKEYTYQASEADSKQTCRTLALEQVKRLLLEEIGTYLESQTEVKNFQLTHDQITTLTAGIVKTEIVTETWDGKEYKLKAKISADPDDVSAAIDNLRKDQQKVKAFEEAKKKIDETIREANQLREELAVLKSKSNRKKKIEQYNIAVKKVRMADLYHKARSSSITDCMPSSDRCKDSVDAFKKVIELDRGNTDAYFECGEAYYNWGKYREAIDMFTAVLKKGAKKRDYVSVSFRNDKNENVYDNRGDAYFYLGNYKAAISDFNKAISLRSTFSRWSVFSYIRRGESYLQIADYKNAVNDYEQALLIASNDDNYKAEEKSGWSSELKENIKQTAIRSQNTDLWRAYQARGRVYGIIGNCKQAVSDYNKAIELFPNAPMNAGTYYLRSLCYRILRNYEQAIKDISKAIDIEPKEPQYYHSRAELCHSVYILKVFENTHPADAMNTYKPLYDQAFDDYKTAARLGYREAQDYLKGAGVEW